MATRDKNTQKKECKQKTRTCFVGVGPKYFKIQFYTDSICASQDKETKEIKEVPTEPPASVAAAWTCECGFLL